MEIWSGHYPAPDGTFRACRQTPTAPHLSVWASPWYQTLWHPISHTARKHREQPELWNLCWGMIRNTLHQCVTSAYRHPQARQKQRCLRWREEQWFHLWWRDQHHLSRQYLSLCRWPYFNKFISYWNHYVFALCTTASLKPCGSKVKREKWLWRKKRIANARLQEGTKYQTPEETAFMEILSVQAILLSGYISNRITFKTTFLPNNNTPEI